VFAHSDALSLHVDGEFSAHAGNGPNNLVLRAAQALQKHTGCTRGASIQLTKNLPVGAGIGGGSSDAAATLTGLNEFWALDLSFEDLLAIAARLGADVPMCLYGKPLYARGIGDEITLATANRATLWMVLVYPHWPLLSKDVFAAIDAPMFEQFLAHAKRQQAAHVLDDYNHLQVPATQLEPRLEGLFDLLADAAIPPGTESASVLAMRMSGSGSCCFVLLDDETQARDCAKRVLEQRPDWWVKAVPVKVGN